MVSVTNFVTCCWQPCTALDLLWPSTCLLSSWGMGYSYVWPVCSNSGEGDYLGHSPCSSPDSLGKASSQSKACVHVATGSQKGKVEWKGCSGERIVLCPSWGRGGIYCTFSPQLSLDYLGMEATAKRRPLPTTSWTPLTSHSKILTSLWYC